MTKTYAKTGGRETLKNDIVSKLQRDIVSQQKNIDCYSFVFIAVHDKPLLDSSVLSPDIYVCF